VLAFRRADGWRLWVLAIYGALLGPAIILVWAVADKVEGGEAIMSFLRPARVALAISFLTTVFYLTAFKYYSRGSIEQAEP
jgi:hypothetical protein